MLTANGIAHERPPVCDDESHPWWGDPPDVPTARRWITILGNEVQLIQADLGAARDGGAFYDDDGHELPRAQHTEWRREKLTKKTRREKRLRWLKEWVDARGGAPRPYGQNLATTFQRDRTTPVEAMHAAVRRFGLLEDLLEAVVDVHADRSEESMERMFTAMELVLAHGILSPRAV